MSELELHGLLDKRDKKISTLMEEKVALVNQVQPVEEILKNPVTETNQEISFCLIELSKKKKTEMDAFLKIVKLEEAV